MRIIDQGNLKIRVNRDEVLKRLKDNRSRHTEIVAEARKGYVAKAKEVLSKKLKQLEQGKVVSLTVRLAVPLDYTEVYDTAIQMLSMHQEDTLEMDGAQVRCLVMDEWDWTKNWALSNGSYSQLAARWATSRGYGQDDDEDDFED